MELSPGDGEDTAVPDPQGFLPPGDIFPQPVVQFGGPHLLLELIEHEEFSEKIVRGEENLVFE